LTVIVPDPTPNFNWTAISACLRGPGTQALESQVKAMLASVQWAGPDPSFSIRVANGRLIWTVSVYDDSGLVAGVERLADPFDVLRATPPGVRADPAHNQLDVAWSGSACAFEPAVGISGSAGHPRVAIDPSAGQPHHGACVTLGVVMGVTLLLTEPVHQNDVTVEFR
jgi:hypothetical protein